MDGDGGAAAVGGAAAALDVEEALDLVGVGRFQWAALACCGAANAADAVEILGMGLVIPALELDATMHLDASGKSALSSCIFLGMLLGGLVVGPAGDAVGRRACLLWALLLNAAFGLMSAAARGTWALVALRFAGGVGVGGSVPVVFSFLAELLPREARGKFMVALAAHWMVGSLFSAGLGWALIPRAPTAWRWFLACASAPAWLAVAGTWLLLPESPRFYLVKGRVREAEQVLHRMAAANGRRLPSGLRLLLHRHGDRADGSRSSSGGGGGGAHLRASHTADEADGSGGSSGGGGGSGGGNMAWHHARGHHSQRGRQHSGSGGAGGASAAAHGAGGSAGGHTGLARARQGCAASTAGRLLTSRPLRQRFLPLLAATVGICGAWYSTVLWLPEYFKARGAGSSSLYAETFAVAAANLPGNVVSIFMVDRLGRRLTACVCLAGACGAALLFAWAPPEPGWSVAAGCAFNGISVGGWNALDLLSSELFPTEVRSTAMGLLGAGGRLASFTTTFLAGKLMAVALWAPLAVAAALLAAGSAAIMLLPESAHQPLDDTLDGGSAPPAASSAAEPDGEHAALLQGDGKAAVELVQAGV